MEHTHPRESFIGNPDAMDRSCLDFCADFPYNKTMHRDFLLILFIAYTLGIIVQKLLKKDFFPGDFLNVSFLYVVLITGFVLHAIIHRGSLEGISLGKRDLVLMILLILAGYYVLYAVIIPWFRRKHESSIDFSPRYKACKQEESEKKRFLEAVLHGDMEVVNQMLGILPERIYLKAPGGELLADYALKQGRQAMAEFLGTFGKALKEKKEMLKSAVVEGDASKAEELAGRDGYLVKVPVDASGATVLHLAAERGNTALAAFFIEKGADLNAKDNEGARPLHYAAALGQLEAAGLLIEKGASAYPCDDGGAQPLHEAAMSGNVAVAKLLIEHGAHPNSADEVFRWTPLYYAEYYDQKEMVDFLLSRGAILSVSDTFGRTPRCAGALPLESMQAGRCLVRAWRHRYLRLRKRPCSCRKDQHSGRHGASGMGSRR
ncbi:MAG: ankyrin repeat domain-containing protein [Candidatus Eremiobacteraeota bacterium]|nr:ankyrin repeat domain-containing protein [Candidatus Eremiobacteraeota bacterium]